MIRIRIDNLKQVQDEFRDIAANQIPFATALALTRTAEDGERSTRDTILPEHFTLRQPAWIEAGVRTTSATKQNLAAVVGDIHPFMLAQDTTGLKLPYGRAIAIPLRGARATNTSMIPRQWLPRAVMQRGGFIRDNIMYMVRQEYHKERRRPGQIGPVNATRGARQIIPMYYLAPQWKWKPRYGFEANIREVVAQTFEGNFAQAFQQAVRTAK